MGGPQGRKVEGGQCVVSELARCCKERQAGVGVFGARWFGEHLLGSLRLPPGPRGDVVVAASNKRGVWLPLHNEGVYPVLFLFLFI